MEIRKLTGGKTFEAKKPELQVGLYADPPQYRVGSPGTAFGNAAGGAQLRVVAKAKFGAPDVQRVRVVIREVDGIKYLLIAPVTDNGDNIYQIKQRGNAPTITGLKELFDAIEFTLRTDTWYVMSSEIVQDDQEGLAVVCNWSDARSEVRERKRRSSAKSTAKTKKSNQGQADQAQPAQQSPAPAVNQETAAAGTAQAAATEQPAAQEQKAAQPKSRAKTQKETA